MSKEPILATYSPLSYNSKSLEGIKLVLIGSSTIMKSSSIFLVKLKEFKSTVSFSVAVSRVIIMEKSLKIAENRCPRTQLLATHPSLSDNSKSLEGIKLVSIGSSIITKSSSIFLVNLNESKAIVSLSADLS